MRHVFYFLAVVFVCLPAYSATDSEAIIGVFEYKVSKSKDSLEIRLECASESVCFFTTISQSGKNPARKDKQILNKVRPIENLIYADNALKYAINQQSRTIQQGEFSELMNRLRPVLSANPVIAKCWDLNYSSAGYMLACTFTKASSENQPIYLFGTLMANCGEAFCRYVIYPMSRVE